MKLVEEQNWYVFVETPRKEMTELGTERRQKVVHLRVFGGSSKWFHGYPVVYGSE